MSEVKKPIVGVAVADFTDEVWRGVAESYTRSAYRLPDDERVESSRWHDMDAARVLGSYGELRLGSLLTMHSKLKICTTRSENMHFNFYDNADKWELEDARQRLRLTPEDIQADFQDRLKQFLGGLGVAQVVRDCYIHS